MLASTGTQDLMIFLGSGNRSTHALYLLCNRKSLGESLCLIKEIVHFKDPMCPGTSNEKRIVSVIYSAHNQKLLHSAFLVIRDDENSPRRLEYDVGTALAW